MSSKAKIYLYKKGNECKEITGGWDISYSVENPVKATKEIDSIRFSGNGSLLSGSKGSLATAKAIQLNSFSKLYFDVETTLCTLHSEGVDFGVTNNRENVFLGSAVRKTRIGRETLYCDIKTNTTGYPTLNMLCDKKGECVVYLHNAYFETNDDLIEVQSNTRSVGNILFSINDLGLVNVKKVEVFVNNQLSEIYNSDFKDIAYTVDESKLTIGDNKVSIRATYTQANNIDEVAEEVVIYKYNATPLPQGATFTDAVDRVKLITNSREIERETLKNILISKNVPVLETDKMSTLIDKVSLLTYVAPPTT